MVERGERESLVLFRLNPKTTSQRAPGPGPIRKVDWKKFAMKRLKGTKIRLHTDGARSYKLKVPGVWHYNVVHQKKKIKVQGKMRWVKPAFVKMFQNRMKDWTNVKVKCGTQIIDRAWGFIRPYLKNRPLKVGSFKMAARIRSAQWVYWKGQKDLWLETGNMLESL